MLSLIEQAELNKNSTDALSIVDMGCGKGYLSFALFDLLKRHFEMKIEMTGIELRKELCDFCNEKARVLGWNGLNFEAMDILDYQEKNNNVLIALHACDIATDIAIYQGIKNNSDLIVVAPCCHKQIRKQMNPKKPWNTLLEHGILMERESELITDSLRSLLLQLNGYKTKVMEFISSVHTPKNIMIAGIKNKSGMSPDMRAAIEKDIEEIKSAFGIKEHYLEKLLRGER
jgi:SAM-dependent methyltransferase